MEYYFRKEKWSTIYVLYIRTWWTESGSKKLEPHVFSRSKIFTRHLNQISSLCHFSTTLSNYTPQKSRFFFCWARFQLFHRYFPQEVLWQYRYCLVRGFNCKMWNTVETKRIADDTWTKRIEMFNKLATYGEKICTKNGYLQLERTWVVTCLTFILGSGIWSITA